LVDIDEKLPLCEQAPDTRRAATARRAREGKKLVHGSSAVD
jgi:hypothetical protein